MTPRERLARDLGELGELWPALDDAATRVEGVQARERVAGGGGPGSSGTPIDLDALMAVQRLRQQAGDQLAHPHTVLNTYDALAAAGHAQAAAQLAGKIAAWRSTCRRLIGLSVADRRLGQLCPRHDDELVELVAPGDQGELVDRLVELDDVPRWSKAVEWTSAACVTCRHCSEVWTPGGYGRLAVQLAAADQRRVNSQLADAQTADAA